MNLQFKMPVGMGLCSVMMILITGTIVCIMSLAFVNSCRACTLTHKQVESTKAYYAADAKANALYFEIEDIYDIYYTASSKREDLMEKAFGEIDEITSVTLGEDAFVTYEVPIDEVEKLQVTLAMQLETESLQIKSWKTIRSEIN